MPPQQRHYLVDLVERSIESSGTGASCRIGTSPRPGDIPLASNANLITQTSEVASSQGAAQKVVAEAS
jgi:hypothetical protein